MTNIDKTVLTPMRPRYRSYKANLSQIMQAEKVFSPEECQQIIDMADDLKKGTVLNPDEVDADYRKSDVQWLEPTPQAFPFMDRMLNLIMEANTKYEFEMDLFEGFQVTRYEKGGHYNWHKDLGMEKAGHRKLSVSVQLSSPDAYEGGDLELWTGHEQIIKCERAQGTVIVFPSWEQHRVTPVTKGERWSLVTWASGTSRFR